VILAAGEEIGWRGYLLTRLIDAGVPRPVLVSGLIWALWHAPLLVGGVYPRGPSIALSLSMFTVTVVAVARAFDAFTGTRSIWLGETGVLVALASVLLARLSCLACRTGACPVSPRP
jgi:membrane protease YdiL (CAAX protease family)